jgi:C_GCAxxG_C_C family probable redox protein
MLFKMIVIAISRNLKHPSKEITFNSKCMFILKHTFKNRLFWSACSMRSAGFSICTTPEPAYDRTYDRSRGNLMNSEIPHPPENFINRAGELAAAYLEKYHACSQATLAPFLEMLGIKNSEPLLSAASLFSGGACRCLACGAVSAGLMIFGIKYGRRRLSDPVDSLMAVEPLSAALIDRFTETYGTVDCCELTGFDLRYPDQKKAFFESEDVRRECSDRVRNTARWIAELISEKESDIDIC